MKLRTRLRHCDRHPQRARGQPRRVAGLEQRELVSLGARPRRAAFSEVGSLTVSELRVARLAAARMTNRAIAPELTVSAKTVSGQLTAVYRKLDVHDREALAAAMAQAGDDGSPVDLDRQRIR